MSLLPEILSSKIRAEIFRMLFGLSDDSLHMREIERRSGFAIGTIQTELKKLLKLDLVKKRRDGNRLYFTANREHPLYPEIHSITLKTVGLAEYIKAVLEKSSEINMAFVFGSLADNRENAESDIDMMVIGELGFRKLVGLLSGVSEQIHREINPHVLSLTDFSTRITAKDHFISSVLESPKIFIIGDENDLRAMVEQQLAAPMN